MTTDSQPAAEDASIDAIMREEAAKHGIDPSCINYTLFMYVTNRLLERLARKLAIGSDV